MESSYSYGARDRKEALDYELRVRMIELAKTKEELRQAKDDMTQSWLRTKLLINELGKLKSNLATTRSRTLLSNTVMSQLEAEFKNTENSIRFKTAIELKLRSKTSDLNQSLDRAREKLEEVGLENDKQRQSRTELKQALRLKRQSLKTLELTLRAIRLDSEAIGASVAGAVRHIYSSEKDTATVELSHEEYHVLVKRAKEETLLADWRISVSVEHRLVAEESRDSALRRLEETLKLKLKERENNEQKGEGLHAITDKEAGKSRIKAEFELTDEDVAYTTPPKLIPWSSKESSLQLSRRIPVVNRKLRRTKRSVQIKGPSLLVRIRSSLIQKVATWFR